LKKEHEEAAEAAKKAGANRFALPDDYEEEKEIQQLEKAKITP